ncbi:hypothetical protein SGRIM128S_05108 [Streptomyces griseomycini]
MFALGLVQKAPCYNGAWFFGASSQYTHACYSDIPHLYQGRGFADGLVPYFDKLPGDMQYLEYPVLTGVFMEVAAWLTPGSGSIQDQAQWYWMANAGMLMVCAAVIAVCVTRTHARRPWDGLLVALAPASALTATINWDLLAVALTAAAMLMWSRGRVLAFGVLLGLATAAKLYPFLLLGPLLVLCWRAGRWRAFGTALAGAGGAWVVVNGPVMLFAFEGWRKFYTFSQERALDFGSFWLIITQRTGKPIDVETVDTACGTRTAILKAEGRYPAIDEVFQAVHRNDPDPKLLAYQYLQVLPQLAQGSAARASGSSPARSPPRSRGCPAPSPKRCRSRRPPGRARRRRRAPPRRPTTRRRPRRPPPRPSPTRPRPTACPPRRCGPPPWPTTAREPARRHRA